MILSQIDAADDVEKHKLVHEFYLQGHDSVVKCMDVVADNNKGELILVSAGGKANIKLWRVVCEPNSDRVNKVTHLYEFKRMRARKSNSNKATVDKPWLYIDLKSNPDIRFMDVRMFVSAPGELMLALACSDGYLRMFRYLVELNKLDLLAKHPYAKCLLCIDMIRLSEQHKPVFVGFGTDGSLLCWKFDTESENAPSVVYTRLHQSGVNRLDLWRTCASSDDES